MGTITAGTGLISGFDTAALIDSLLAIEGQSRIRLQIRSGSLQAQQSALLDVNSQLLAFKGIASSFRRDSVFRSVIATTNNDEVLNASVTNKASPGTYSFHVKQLVSSSQYLSGGFATRNESPLGLSTLNFEFGQGRLTRDASLDDLNGGDGVKRGEIEITDKAGDTATVDLTDVTSINEVIDRINSTNGIDVVASVGSQGLIVTDTSGGAGTLAIDDATGSTTATDLGIDDDVASNTGTVSTGASIFYLGSNTSLSSLNDGNGVLVRSNVDDLVITSRVGTAISIDLGRIDNDIDDATLLEDLNDGEGVRIDDDNDTTDIKFTTREGTEYEIDLTGLTTVGGLKSRISAQSGGEITLSVHADGNKFTVTDTTAGTGLLKVEGTADSDDDAAVDLGILEVDGVAANTFDGEVVPSTIDQAEVTTLQDVIDRINNDSENTGEIVASIRADGLGLRIQDTTGGGTDLIIASTVSNPDAARQLGIETAGFAGSDFTSTERIIGGLDSVLVNAINGGNGLNAATTIDVTDRNGQNFNFTTLDTYDTIGEIVAVLNSEATANGVGVTFAVNDAGNGLSATDTTGMTGNLTISGDAATELGIAVDDAVDSYRGSNVQRQYVNNASRLADLNYGRGVDTGSFRITDSEGQDALVSIGGTEKTLYDIIQEINSKGLAINARVNDNGDGLIIEDTSADAVVKLKVEAVAGSTARDLNIVGEADTVGDDIDGSYERTIDVDPTDTLETVVSKLNDANIPVSASIVNTGSGARPFLLSLTSLIEGSRGDLVIDSGNVDLSLNEIADGKDAKVLFGSARPEDAFILRSASNQISNVVTGLTIDLLKTSDDPVTVTIARNDAAVLGAVNGFAAAFNDAIDKIDGYDFFDVETEERGLLFGNPTTQSVRASLIRIGTGRALNVDGQYQFLSQIGFSLDREGHFSVDDAKFRTAFEDNPEAVEDLLAKYDVTLGSTTEVVSGVTVSSNDTTYNALGIANLMDRLLGDLTDSIDGLIPRADDALENQISGINDRIEFLDSRLQARREQLTREFTNLELVLADLQTQASALSNFTLPTLS